MARWQRQVSICAILGAATSILIAWACVVMLPEELQIASLRPPDFGWLERHRRSPERPYGQNVSQEFGVRTDLFDSLRGEYSRIFAKRHRAGFPLPSLDGGAWEIIPSQPVKPWGETERVEGITAIVVHTQQDDYIALPCKPIWPGLLANTAIYAGAWWLPLFGAFLLRGALRRQRGRCPGCGYDLRGELAAGCPECGWRRSDQGTRP